MTVKLRNLLTAAALLIFSAVAAAQSFQVDAPGSVIQGSRFYVTYVISNIDAQVSRAQAPKLEGCTLLSGPNNSTMQSTTIINRQAKTEYIVQSTFIYRADKAGTVTVPPLTIKDNKRSYSTRQVTIRILPPDKNTPRQNAAPNPYAQMPEQQVKQGPQISDKDVIITVTLSKNQVYVNEPVIATIRLYCKHYIGISGFRSTTPPTFEGFMSEPLPTPQDQQLVHFRGDNYNTVTLNKYLLFPQKDGKLTINSGRYDLTLTTYDRVSYGFYEESVPVNKEVTTTTNQVSLDVKPLPANAPAGFTGAVGSDFKVSNSLEPSLLRTNEAATYTLTITGNGNIKYLTTPTVDFGPNVEQYEPETQNDAKFNGTTLSGSFTTTYTIIPQAVGQVSIAEAPFAYFNPQTGKYVTVTIPGIERRVVKGNDAAAGSTAATDQMNDIRHIKTLSGQDLYTKHHRWFHDILYILCYVIAAAGLTGVVIVYRRYVRLSADVEGRRMSRANAVATKRLKAARAMMNAHNSNGFYDAIASALWGYISDKLRMPASTLTRENISERLKQRDVPEPLIDRTIRVLDDCEMARFTPQHFDAELSDLYNGTAAVIRDLETYKRRSGRKAATQTAVAQSEQTAQPTAVNESADTESADTEKQNTENQSQED